MTREPETRIVTDEMLRAQSNRIDMALDDIASHLPGALAQAETRGWNAALAAVEEAVRELEFDNERDGQPSSGVYQDLLSRLAALRKGASE